MRALVKFSLFVLVVLIAALVLARGALELSSVQARLATALSALLSTRDVTVKIEGLGGSLPFAPRVARVEIADRGGTWLTIEGLRAEIAPLPLLGREVHVEAIAADRVTIARQKLPGDHPFHLRPLRLNVRVDSLDVGEILLGRELLTDDRAATWSAPIAAHASGVVDLRRLTLDVALSGSIPEVGGLAPRFGIAAGKSRLTAALRGAIEAPSGEATLQVAELGHADVRAAAIEIRAMAERLGMGERRYRIDATGAVHGLSGAPAALQSQLGAEPSFKGIVRFGATPRVFDVERLTVAGAAFAADVAASSAGGDEIAISSLVATWPDLGAVPEAQPTVEHGTLRLRGHGNLVLAHDAATLAGADLELAMEAGDLDLVDPRLQALLGAAPTLNAKLTASSPDAWSADELALVGASLRAGGRARFDASTEQVGADLTFSLLELAVLGDAIAGSELAGSVEGVLTIGGDPKALDVRSTLRPQRLRVGKGGTVGGELTVAGRGSRAAATAEVAATLTVDGAPLTAKGNARYSEERGTLRVDGLSILSRGVRVDVDGDVALASRLATGSVRLDSKDLSAIAPLLGLDAAGQLSGRIDLAHDGRTQTLRFSADASDLRLAGLLDAPVTAATLSLHGEVRDLAGSRDGKLDAHATRVAWQELDVTDVTLDVERSRGQTSFRADSAGKYRGNLALAFAGRQSGDLESGTVVFDRIHGSVHGHKIEGTKPLELAIRRREVAVRRLGLAVDSGSIEGEWGEGGVRGVGSIRATDLPLDFSALVTDEIALGGRLTAEISRSGRGEDLLLRARSSEALVGAGETLSVTHGFALDLTARAGPWRSHVDARVVAAIDASTVSLDADLPFGFIGGSTGAPLGGHIRGSLTPGLIDDIVLPDNETLDGKLDIDLTLGGTLEAPLFDGRAGGHLHYTSGNTGMELDVDSIELRAAGHRVDIVSLHGTDRRKGRLDGKGTVELPHGASPSHFDLGLTFNDLVLAKLDSVDLRGDGVLALRGPGDALVLGGTFSADEATLRVPENLPPDIVTLPVEHVNVDASRSSPDVEEKQETKSKIALDLALDFPGRIRVEDPNIDSEWRGKLFVRGDTAKPDVEGELVVVRGRFDLAGIRFTTTEGRLSFEEESNVPLFDITMTANRHEIEATMRILGPADKPSISLTSIPPLPQDEILSRLMFGESAGTLTPGQSLQLAQAAARLSGRGPGLSSTVLARVRRMAGVDRIEIKDSDDATQPSTAVSVGKYIGDRVYVSYDQAVHGQGSKARVEVEMTKHLSAETEVGQNENASVGLRWRWDY